MITESGAGKPKAHPGPAMLPVDIPGWDEAYARAMETCRAWREASKHADDCRINDDNIRTRTIALALLREIESLERDLLDHKRMLTSATQKFGAVLTVAPEKARELQVIGRAQGPSKEVYEFGVTGAPENNPFVGSTVSGRMFLIQWKELIKMAMSAGVNERDSKIIIPS